MTDDQMFTIENMCFGVLGSVPLSFFAEWVDLYSYNDIVEALRETENAKKDNPKYVDRILREGINARRICRDWEKGKRKEQGGRRANMLT